MSSDKAGLASSAAPQLLTEQEELSEWNQFKFIKVLVSLNNNEVHIYRDKYIISKFKVQDAVVGMKFGKFGREDANLIFTTRSNLKVPYYDR